MNFVLRCLVFFRMPRWIIYTLFNDILLATKVIYYQIWRVCRIARKQSWSYDRRYPRVTSPHTVIYERSLIDSWIIFWMVICIKTPMLLVFWFYLTLKSLCLLCVHLSLCVCVCVCVWCVCVVPSNLESAGRYWWNLEAIVSSTFWDLTTCIKNVRT